MRIFEIIPALIFVLSSGLLFNKRFRENQVLVGVAGLIALVASYFLFEEVMNRVVKSHLEKQAEASKPAPAPPVPIPVPPPPAPVSAPTPAARTIALSPVDQILAPLKPSVCPSYTEDQTRATTSLLLGAADQAGQRGDRSQRVRLAEQAMGLWLCLPDQNDAWIRDIRDQITGSLGTAKFQLGERREGCTLILQAYQRAKQRNDRDSQNLLMMFVPDC